MLLCQCLNLGGMANEDEVGDVLCQYLVRCDEATLLLCLGQNDALLVCFCTRNDLFNKTHVDLVCMLKISFVMLSSATSCLHGRCPASHITPHTERCTHALEFLGEDSLEVLRRQSQPELAAHGHRYASRLLRNDNGYGVTLL